MNDSAGIIVTEVDELGFALEKQKGCTFCGSIAGHSSWCLEAEDVRTFSLTWVGDAICGDEEMFGPGRVDARLLDLCNQCPVRRQCAEYALATRSSQGVWGGLTPDRRTDILAGVLSLEEVLAQ